MRSPAGGQLIGTRVGPVEYAEAGLVTGQPVLYFHGAPGGHDQLRVLDRLTRGGCRVIGWSRPGYLRTLLETGRTFPEQADAAAALLDELGLTTVVAYGISAGGPSAIEFARRHPARATALVLESAVSRHYSPVIHPLVKAIYLSGPGTWLLTRLAERWTRAAVADFVRQESTLDRSTRREVVNWILADNERLAMVRTILASLTPYRDRAAGLENDLEQLAGIDDSLTAGVACPTLVLHGSHDGDVDAGHARHAAGTIPDAVLHVVAEGWHLLPLSVNGHTADEATSAFLRRPRTPASPGC